MDQGSFFCIWISTCSSTICCKDCSFPTTLPDTFVNYSAACVFVDLFLDSVVSFWSVCLSLCQCQCHTVLIIGICVLGRTPRRFSWSWPFGKHVLNFSRILLVMTGLKSEYSCQLSLHLYPSSFLLRVESTDQQCQHDFGGSLRKMQTPALPQTYWVEPSV